MAMMELAADRRRDTGKEINRKRRAGGRVPGVIYGRGLETRSIEFERKPLEKFLDTARRGTVVVKMTVRDGAEGKESFAVLKEVQTHPLTDQVTHVDFYEVALGQKFRVEIPIRIRGKAAGIELGGILEVVMRSLEVECTPDQVPEFIEVDVSSLGIGQSLYLGSIQFPPGVVPTEKDLRLPVAAVHTPKAEAAPVAAEAVEGEAAEGASVAEGAEKEEAAGKEKEGAKEPAKKEKKEK
ncbi:MAG: ribosomal rRNA E-loop binding protein Ctc/L25/TL5 [Deltaproteobacteria bacterium]|nr:ribosomal rRNA E-loop binding protein Ctc/L25/TL5 [Deltaproteobacteria bacterium]